MYGSSYIIWAFMKIGQHLKMPKTCWFYFYIAHQVHDRLIVMLTNESDSFKSLQPDFCLLLHIYVTHIYRVALLLRI